MAYIQYSTALELTAMRTFRMQGSWPSVAGARVLWLSFAAQRELGLHSTVYGRTRLDSLLLHLVLARAPMQIRSFFILISTHTHPTHAHTPSPTTTPHSFHQRSHQLYGLILNSINVTSPLGV